MINFDDLIFLNVPSEDFSRVRSRDWERKGVVLISEHSLSVMGVGGNGRRTSDVYETRWGQDSRVGRLPLSPPPGLSPEDNSRISARGRGVNAARPGPSRSLCTDALLMHFAELNSHQGKQ